MRFEPWSGGPQMRQPDEKKTHGYGPYSLFMCNRYIIQRAFTRFQHINKPSLLVPLLQHGLILYDDLALHKNDGQQFKELLPYASQNQHNHMTFIMQARLEALDDLVNTYGFDVNFCKWSNVTGLPLLHTNEGMSLVFGRSGYLSMT